MVLPLALGCDPRPRVGEVPPRSVDAVAVERAASDPARVGPLVLAHGGQGSPASRSDGPAVAVDRGFARLESEGEDAVAAAIATIESLEDDPRFNAGTGANLRLDARSIEADAALMDDRARFGAVAGIADLRHPIRVAEAVAASPHLLLVGEGAQAFAGTLGLEARDLSTPQARAKLARGYAKLFAGEAGPWSEWDWRRHWNFATPAPAKLDEAMALLEAAEAGAQGEAPDETPDETKDTVGVVVRTAQGRYAAALSTGGTTLAIHGRVGDVPLLGAGLYAGPHGAVAATGKGEAIIRELVAARVYELLARGQTPADAIRLVTREISPEEGVGVIAVSDLGWGTGATSQMAWAARDRDARHRADTWIQRQDR
ncbi:N(4)-(Beta-N-acetylglucosaminyl)-L-asparaginase precursor [Enhygromyxa salina]|uniref:N(4)-(Beta-N-acetylglucosaminyl)-L-asparaginase n=1 Tax=Enhygromyxa salina TaxID=215803 RepID=A0A2S9XHV1_9BACT|nr:isoaspartyl peptidase/L-asparaginase [Enhygromyxa salina]PRP92443.1 N(4)-(Beta-N-acetylglucosaminyl)-L-asparaginase precursor [Enhygromyxa salina]